MKILAIDTSCDETAAAVTKDLKIRSNIIWSQASAHAKFGGVMPSLAQRMHEERIDWVIDRAIKKAKTKFEDLDAIAVTTGPGLSIALGVGIDRAKKLAKKYSKPIIPVNHVVAHLLSSLAESGNSNPESKFKIQDSMFPAYGLVVSGGNTIFVLINKIGDYKILAQTVDDALGEALDKGARMLGLGYPGGAILEEMALLRFRQASEGQAPNPYKLPIPLVGQEKRQIFSYSGLKTSFYRLITSHKEKDPSFPSKEAVYDLAATYQDTAFRHIERVVSYIISNQSTSIRNFFLGGGVGANKELRKHLRAIGKVYKFSLKVPYSVRLYGDNAAMIGVAAYLNPEFADIEKVDRNPQAKISA